MRRGQVLAICTLTMWIVCIVALHIYAGGGRAPRRFELVIAKGTDELVAAGENPLELPKEWDLVSGDVLVLDNQEDTSQTIGAWEVAPGQTREILLRPYTGIVQCTLHPDGEITMNVAPRVTDWKLALIATLAFGPMLGLGALAVARVGRALHDEPERTEREHADDGTGPVAGAGGRPPSWLHRHGLALATSALAAGAVVATLLVLQPWRTSPDATLAGFVESPTPQVGALTLPSTGGVDTAFRGPDDGLLLVVFGYTSCPDVCPTTMSMLSRAVDRAVADGVPRDHLRVAMVTVDPARDTAAQLGDYVSFFVDGSVGLRTDDARRLRSVADAFGVTYELGPQESDGSYEVVHSSFVYGVDDAGRVVVAWPATIGVDAVAHDLRLLAGDHAADLPG